jgi:hypothetical protein
MRSQQPVEAEEEAQVDCSIGPHGYWGWKKRVEVGSQGGFTAVH